MDTYDVALSFAGEDRPYVDQVAALLRDAGIRVFYDEYAKAELWGKDLYTYFRKVYQEQAKYTVMFVSEHYAKKRWPNHERESAQARAFAENREYILPARFDDTSIPGLTPTTGYVDLRTMRPGELVGIIAQKLRSPGIEIGRWSSPQQAFIMHAATRGSVNLEYTVTKRRRIREIADGLRRGSAEHQYFSEDQTLHRRFPSGQFNCWGVQSAARGMFGRTNVGDLVLFVGPLGEDAAIRQLGIVKVKSPIECPDASRILWPEAFEGKAYPLLFFFDSEVGLRGWDAFLSDIHRPGYNPRGWYRQIGNKYFSDFGGPTGYLRYLRHAHGFIPLATS